MDDYEVFVVDDELICDVNDDWLYRAQRTVYLLFYSKNGPSYFLTTHMDNPFYPMRTENEKNNQEEASHTEDQGQERNNCNVQKNSFDRGFTSIDELTRFTMPRSNTK